MPLYEYQCEKCKIVHEIFMNLSDKAPEKCASCGEKDSLKKIMSRTHFVLKGQGWYETDFKQKNEPKEDKQVKKETNNKSTTPQTDKGGDKKETTTKQQTQKETKKTP